MENLRIKEIIWKDISENKKEIYHEAIMAIDSYNVIFFKISNCDDVDDKNEDLYYWDNLSPQREPKKIDSILDGRIIAQQRLRDFVMQTYFEVDSYSTTKEQVLCELMNACPDRYFITEKLVKQLYLKQDEHGIDAMFIVDDKYLTETKLYDDMWEELNSFEILYKARKIFFDFSLLEESEHLNVKMLNSDGYELAYDVNEGIKLDSLNKVITSKNKTKFLNFIDDELKYDRVKKEMFDDVESYFGKTYAQAISEKYKQQDLWKMKGV